MQVSVPVQGQVERDVGREPGVQEPSASPLDDLHVLRCLCHDVTACAHATLVAPARPLIPLAPLILESSDYQRPPCRAGSQQEARKTSTDRHTNRDMDAGPSTTRPLVTAVACAVSAGVHAALVVPHLHESPLLASAFAGSVVALLAAALLLAGSPADVRTRRGAGLLLLLMCCAYVATRTTGLPVLAPEPEALDPVGVATQAVQLTGAAFAFLPTQR